MTPGDALKDATVLAERKEWSAAADALLKSGDAIPVLDKLAFYLSRAKRYDEAIKVLRALCNRQPHASRHRYTLGFQFAQREEWTQAIQEFEQAVRLSPEYLKAHYRLAQAYLRSGDEIRAQIAASRVLRLWHKLDPEGQKRDAVKLARASYMLGRLQLRRDPYGAAELLKQAAEYEPQDHNKHYLLGKALTRAGRPKEAQISLERAKQMEPRKSYIDIEFIRAIAGAGDPEGALAKLRDFAPKFRAWDAYNAGRLARELGDQALARGMLEVASKRGPTRGDPRVIGLLEELGSPDGVGSAEVDGGAEHIGQVVLLNPRRKFGFLVDADGTKRHFRLDCRAEELQKGGRVSFVPRERDRGPAADNVRLAS
jgi:tetratricopeptide (TPR) repeat protein/cold shock CspA family protein